MRRILVTGLVGAAVACTHHAGTTPEPVPPAVAVTVNVTNNYASTMEIYAVGGGTSYHVGSVAPGIPRTFELRPAMLAAGGRVRLVAQATGAGPRFQSDELVLKSGDIVDFEILTNLIGSRVTVRP